MKKIQSASLVLISTFAINLMAVSTVSAEIFKCTNKSGKVYYNDKPCPTNAKEKKLKAVKDPTNGYVPPVAATTNDDKKKKLAKEKDLFGTPQYKGKETARQHDARVKFEESMANREKNEKERIEDITNSIDELQKNGQMEEAQELAKSINHQNLSRQ